MGSPGGWIPCPDTPFRRPSAQMTEAKRLRTPCLPRMLAAPAAALAVAGCSGPRSMLDPAGPAAEQIATIWWVMFWGAVAVWALVAALLAVTLLRGQDTRAL